MKLSEIKFNGLKHFKDGTLNIPKIGNSSTVFVGPNASGKTTILRIISSLFIFLDKHQFNEKILKNDEWYGWESASITFSVDQDGNGGEKIFVFDDFEDNFVTITISRNNKELFLSKIETNSKSIELKNIKSPYLPNPMSEIVKSQILEMKKSKEQLRITADDRRLLNQKSINERKIKIEKDSAELEKNISIKQKELEESELELLNFIDSKTKKEEEMSRSRLTGLLEKLNLPKAKLIEVGENPSASIDKLLADAIISKKGRKAQNQKYNKIKEELSVLLEGDADVAETKELKQYFYLDHAQLEQLSHGTQICLFYYSLIYETEPNTIILWDEPENGLHATRRFKLLNLFLNDSRQFFLGTHATEFTPVLNKNAQIYQITSSTIKPNELISISLRHCTDRREAFQIAENLGIFPATTLFTSNVVIWVEGPSELFFWRKWISDEAKKHSLVEGFDYTFLMYGGSNISHQEIEDDPGLVVGFDLLSVCRYPLVIVDSDFIAEPTGPLPFKKGVQEIKDSIDKLNSKNPETALFKHTAGRELENYFPEKAIRYSILELGKYTETEKQLLQSTSFALGKFEHYYESINSKFVAQGLVGDTNKAKNYSLWGENRKVNFVKVALNCPGLTCEDMSYNFKILLEEIVGWIKSRRL